MWNYLSSCIYIIKMYKIILYHSTVIILYFSLAYCFILRTQLDFKGFIYIYRYSQIEIIYFMPWKKCLLGVGGIMGVFSWLVVGFCFVFFPHGDTKLLIYTFGASYFIPATLESIMNWYFLKTANSSTLLSKDEPSSKTVSFLRSLPQNQVFQPIS